MQLGTAVSRTGLLPCLASLSRELPLQRSFVTSPGWRSNLEAWPHNTSRSNAFSLTRTWVWAPPRSLATTSGISVDVCSSGYLDVSVPRVAFDAVCVRAPMHGHGPVRVFPFGDLRLVSDICSLPQLIAASHVLHRLPMPRHPPCALDIFLHTNNRFAIHAKKLISCAMQLSRCPGKIPRSLGNRMLPEMEVMRNLASLSRERGGAHRWRLVFPPLMWRRS